MQLKTHNPISSLWTYRSLLLQFSRRAWETRHKGSYLGILWAVLNPLMMLALYVMVFGYIFEGSFGVLPDETKFDYGLGIFTGLIMFHFFAEIMGNSVISIVSNPNLVKKVVFPLEILPASQVLAAAGHLVVGMTLVIMGSAAAGHLTIRFLIWLPIIILPLIMTCMGVGWALSSLGVYFRDLTQLVQFLSLALMFASAVFYPVSSIPASIWAFLKYNPLLLAIEQARNVVLWDSPVNMTHLGYLYLFGIMSSTVGYFLFKKLKSTFSDSL